MIANFRCILRSSIRKASSLSDRGKFSTTVANNPNERSCWKCGHHSDINEIFCLNLSCTAVQPIDLNSVNYFRLLGVKANVVGDDTSLENGFKALQRKLHPDKFGTKSDKEKDISLHNSSVVNQAYQVKIRVEFLSFIL